MNTTKHTPGPWTWDMAGCCLRPVNARPEVSFIHTILSPDGPFGYLGANGADVQAEDAANRRLIAAAPNLLKACRRATLALAFAAESSAAMHDDYEAISAAIAEATGSNE